MTIEEISLDSFGGFEAEQTLRLAGIETVILSRNDKDEDLPPHVQIVRRYPSHNKLADFLHVFLRAEDYDKNRYGHDNTAYADINNLKQRIDQLLEEGVTGSGYSSIRTTNESVPEKVNEVASRILLYGLKRLILGKGWTDHEFFFQSQ